jgi:segregation and condensation protein B
MMNETEEMTVEHEDVPSVHDEIADQAGAPSISALVVDSVMLRKIIEGAILAAGQPMTIARLTELFDENAAPSKEAIEEALLAIQADCAERGFELKEVASGWRFQVRENLAGWVNRLWEEKPQKYSRALLETLALIAYRQPITRGDIEEIRGVAVSSHIMKTLLERDWVKVVGHRDVPGRPSLYATTRQFLDYFNLKRLEELPSLSEIRDLDEMNSALELNVDDEGLGERDSDLTQATDVIMTEPEEFVDGEAAFEMMDQDAVLPVPLSENAISNESESDDPIEPPEQPHNA